MKKLGLGLLLLASVSCHAGLIAWDSVWLSNRNTTGVLNLVYDDTVADSNPAANVGRFANALQSATFSLEGQVYSLDPSGSSDIVISTDGFSSVTFTASLAATDGTPIELLLRVQSLPGLAGVALADLAASLSPWESEGSLSGGGLTTYLVMTDNLGFASVPEPASAGLLAVALAGLCARRVMRR